IAVMRNGRILQYDHPTKVYDRPADSFVGGFSGNPPMNFLRGQVQLENSSPIVNIGDFTLTPSETMLAALRPHEGKPVLVGIRAENMEALSQPTPDALQVKVRVLEPLGSQNLLTIPVGQDTIKVSTHPDFVA